jgi:iron complex outermembrane receptor protein
MSVVLLLFIALRLSAQQDTSNLLPSVTISALSLRTAMPGERTERFDSTQLSTVQHQSLADLLSGQSGVYIKSYGLGSLATSSMRGGSASQTAILWNGLPIQSPMLGLTDLSLLPAVIADEVSIHYGSSGAQWGSGAVGGVLSIQNKMVGKGKGLHYNGSTGSFGLQSHQAKLHWSNGRLSVVSKLFTSKAANDFSYSTNPDLPAKKQTNAAVEQRGFLQELYWTPSAKSQISMHVWRQFNHREIPPTTTQNKSLAQQTDLASRILLQAHLIYKKHVLQAKSAVWAETIDFQDEQTGLRALSGFKTYLLELEDKWQLSQGWQAQIGAQQTWYQASADGYKDTLEEVRSAVFGNLRYQRNRFNLQLTARQEWQDGRAVPFMPGLGAAYYVSKGLEVHARLSRHYRLPTLNDRYWRLGGNLGLLPESGWGIEGGLKGRGYSVTAFHRLIDNWILWSVAEGQVYWSANNITAVRSRGVEQRFFYTHKWKSMHLRATTGYDWVRSTNEIALTRPKLAAGEQLIYTPVHRAFVNIDMGWKTTALLWTTQYTSSTKGINDGLSAFLIHNARINYGFQQRRWGGHCFFQVDNVFDVSYRVVERRPMPGRSYRLGAGVRI